VRVREANEVLGRIKTPSDGYKALAAAIIAMACDDYFRYAKANDWMSIQRIEKFFLSERFEAISAGVDGQYILRRLKENCGEVKRKYAEPKTARPIKQFDEHGNLIAKYDSITAGAKSVAGDRKGIIRAIENDREYHGYYWGFA